MKLFSVAWFAAGVATIVLDPADSMIDRSVGSPVAGMFDSTNAKRHPDFGAEIPIVSPSVTP